MLSILDLDYFDFSECIDDTSSIIAPASEIEGPESEIPFDSVPPPDSEIPIDSVEGPSPDSQEAPDSDASLPPTGSNPNIVKFGNWGNCSQSCILPNATELPYKVKFKFNIK